MIHLSKLAQPKKRVAYRAAVQACLETFYNQPTSTAKALVDAWWHRISERPSFHSGLFMHAEPINTAALIARQKVVEISEDNEAIYDRLLKRCRDLAAHTKVEKTSATDVASTKTARQLIREKETMSRAKAKRSKAGQLKHLIAVNS